MTSIKQWRLVSAFALELPRTARGLASTGGAPEDLYSAFDLDRQAVFGIRGLLRSRSEPVVMVELDTPLEARGGQVTPAAAIDQAMGPMDVVLDARAAPASATWRHAGALVRLSVDHGSVQLEVDTGPARTEFGSWPLVELPDVPPPDVEASLRGVVEWLASQVRAAAGGTAIQRAGALALVARFHTVPLLLSLDGRGPWPDAIAAWRALPGELRANVVQHALFSAEALGAEFDVLDSLVAQPAQAALVFAELCLRRDDLESLALLVEKAGDPQAPELRFALSAIDRLAIVAATSFPRLQGRGRPERLEALSWADPAAWWSAPP